MLAFCFLINLVGVIVAIVAFFTDTGYNQLKWTLFPGHCRRYNQVQGMGCETKYAIQYLEIRRCLC